MTEVGSETEQRWRALEEHEHFEAWMRHTPPVPRVDRRALFAFVAGLAVVGGILATGIATMCAPLAVVPLILVGFGIYGMLRQYLLAKDPPPLERLPLLVVEEATGVAAEVAGSRTRYLHKVELRGGEQRELETAVDVLGKVRPGRMGIAFVRGGRIVEFAHFPV